MSALRRVGANNLERSRISDVQSQIGVSAESG
jgi:hypothetical protein